MSKSATVFTALPPVSGRSVEARFDAGLMSSDGGVLALARVEKMLGIADALAGCVDDRRDPSRTVHGVSDMLRFRMLMIAAGYEDADDCDRLRRDPAFKLAGGFLPSAGRDLCSQPTMCRLENAPRRREVARMMGVMVDMFCSAFSRPPGSIVLDIDDTVDRVHGSQQLGMFNGYHETVCFLPIHVYEANSGLPVAILLRDGRPPKGTHVRAVLRLLAGRIRKHWPDVDILVRGDSHYARREAMEWMEGNGVDYVLGLAANPVLERRVRAAADDAAVRRAEGGAGCVRRFQIFAHRAGSWTKERRVIARIEASRTRGMNRRYVVTTLPDRAKVVYDKIYCARGDAENRIFDSKAVLASDRTSCRSRLANQVRVILHGAAHLLLAVFRTTLPKRSVWKGRRLDTVRAGLIKIAALVEEKKTRITVRMPGSCPVQKTLAAAAMKLASLPP